MSVGGKLTFAIISIEEMAVLFAPRPFTAFSASNMNEVQRKVFRIHEHCLPYVSNEKALF